MASAVKTTVVDKLPVEILCDVFLMSLPERNQEHFMNSVLAPLRISHVCQRWRALSLSTRELWSYLHLDFYEIKEQEQRRRMIDILDTWIERTNGSPLNFAIWCSIMTTTEAYEKLRITTEYIISTLLAERWRWKDVDFKWPVSFVKVEMTDMPMLTSLTLYLFEPSGNNLVFEDSKANVNLARSLRLRRLYLRGNFDLVFGKEPIYTSTGPVRLAFTSNTPQMVAERSCLDLLRVAPNLKPFCAEFLGVGHDPNLQMNLQDTQLVHDLEMLTIRHSSILMNSLTLPKLKALSYYPDSLNIRLVPVLNFVRRSMPPLTRLEIHGPFLSVEEDGLVPILRLLPALREFRIARLSTPSQLYQTLAVTDISVDEEHSSTVNSILCPDLRYLRLDTIVLTQDVETRLDDLCGMLISRNSVLNMFKRVICGSWGEFAISDISSNIGMLNRRLERGYSLTISDGGI